MCFYVWLEMGEFSGIDAPVGTIRLLWEGNEPYTEGNELVQDPPSLSLVDREFFDGESLQ